MSDAAEAPRTMRAAVTLGRGRLEVQQRPVPVLGPGDALLRVSHCGVCGTDLHLTLEGWGRPDSIGGHEFSGRIASLGPEVRGFAVGDAVVGGPRPGCGACDPCRARRPSLCEAHAPTVAAEVQGAFAEYVKVAAPQLVRVPAGVGLREAALAEPLAVALHALTQGEIAPGRRALVTGLGPIGALVLAGLRARGVDDVVVSEPAPLRRSLAARLGAASVVEPAELERPAMPFASVEDAVDVAFECSGRPEAVEAALCQLGKGGRLVLVGTGMQRPRLDANRVILNELVVTGAYEYDEGGVGAALELIAGGALPTDALLEPGDVALEELAAAMARLAGGEIAAKVLVAPNGLA